MAPSGKCNPRQRAPDFADYAQEFLRRNGDYQRQFAQLARMHKSASGSPAALRMAHTWGLEFPFDPNVSHDLEPAIWRSDNCAFVVTLAGPIDRWPELLESVIGGDATCDRTGPAGRHLIIDSNGMRHRLLLRASYDERMPAYLLPATGQFSIRAAAIAAYHFRSDHPASLADACPLKPTLFQHHRFRLILALLDARSGTGQPPGSLRQTAAAIFGDDLSEIRAIEWKTASRRRYIQRLLADGLKLVEGGYRELLNARMPTKGANLG